MAVIVVINCSWIYNFLCNQCVSRIKLWVRILLIVSMTCGRSRSVIFSVYSINKTYRHDLNEILLKLAFNTITSTYIFLGIINWTLTVLVGYFKESTIGVYSPLLIPGLANKTYSLPHWYCDIPRINTTHKHCCFRCTISSNLLINYFPITSCLT